MAHSGKPSKAMKKRIAILQSNYIPWKGYFDIIAGVDEFILYDDVQFTKNDWRNRNRIKTVSGSTWLSIPVYHRLNDKIRDVKVSRKNWNIKHWKTLQQNYSKAASFSQVKPFIEELYGRHHSEFLSEINFSFITAINEFLGINTTITRSSDYQYSGDKSERILALCKAANAEVYISGSAAMDYLDVELFKNENIRIEWADYRNYPEYPQLHPPFEEKVTILDLIMTMGHDAGYYLKMKKTHDHD